jgi:hypothetical protein
VQGVLEAQRFVGDALAPKKMLQTGDCGFYCAVDRPGHIALFPSASGRWLIG